MKPIRTVSVFPTLFTLGNLVCGFFAIVVASRIIAPQAAPGDAARLVMFDPRDPTDFMISAWLIFLAMVFDALDGYVARLANSTSRFGAELDSLADLVTFGVAPAFLLVKMVPQFALLHKEAVWVIASAFVACAALRLARFNVETGDEDDHLTFIGLPSPAAAAAVASFAILFYTLRREDTALVWAAEVDSVLQTILPPFALLMALLMVSRIPYPHVVNQLLRGQRSFGHVVAIVFALVAVMVVRGYSVTLVCCTFALSGPVHYAWQKIQRRREREEPLF